MDDLPADLRAALKELSQHYEDFEQNDRGANGYLFFAINKVTKTQIAIKFYAGEQGDARHDEPRQLGAIKSRNVLPILDARNISEEWGYFITPRCFEGDVDDLIAEQPSSHAAIDVALGICNGVSAIHAMNMLHRDLKPGNVVLLHSTPQIADFGSVRILSGEEQTVSASMHSALFRPPESFATGRYSVKGDLYQIGLVAYQLLGGSLPYDGEEYLTPKQRAAYQLLDNWPDRSIYVDGVIRDRAVAGNLLNFRSLPPWVGMAAKRSLRAITHHDPDERVSSIADVAAALTQMRASVLNWGWHGEIATLVINERKIEVRPSGENDGLYQAYLSSRAGVPFRRIAGIPMGPLASVIAGI